MVPSIDVTVDFRTAQAVSDLRAVARRGTPATLERVTAGAPNKDAAGDLHRLIHDGGCRISNDLSESLHSALMLMATLPDDDLDGFVVATAVLLADRLQNGRGKDDLFWHWDAFRQHYALAPSDSRAAIMQGYLQANRLGLVALFDLPEEGDLISRPKASLLKALALPPAGTTRGFRGVIQEVLTGQAEMSISEDMWRDHWQEILSFPEPQGTRLLLGLRHLYETNPDWSPFGGRKFSLFDMALPLLPFDRDLI
ncbi:MAG: hypothetical protein HKO95_07585 [Rhodobacteraceae bacterium]|nr:hypothetical protein [Alphaproteobacteria bacterium]MBT8475939.1 hypothetical protein [Alphaproteobacteria bacterium]NNK66582.1 hypothetical protein [Paracoccaceae bacterium]